MFLNDHPRHRPVAAADRDEEHNRARTDLLTGPASRPTADPGTALVVDEAGHLPRRAGGVDIEAAFPRSIVQRTFTVVDLELDDYARMAELVETP